MKLLLDTHILLWAAGQPDRLTTATRDLLTAPENALYCSVVSLWEIVIKCGLGRDDFSVDPRRLRNMLLAHGFLEVEVAAEHVLQVDALPALHKDPFDRLLLAQARSEGLLLLTMDGALLQYGQTTLAAP